MWINRHLLRQVLWDLEPLDDEAGQKLVRDLEAKAQDEVIYPLLFGDMFDVKENGSLFVHRSWTTINKGLE